MTRVGKVGKPGMVRSEMNLFTRPGQVAHMVLADGFRFMVLNCGRSPHALPITESGVWEIDIPELLAKGRYPVGVITIDAAHVKAFKTLPGSVVTKMLEAAAKESAS